MEQEPSDSLSLIEWGVATRASPGQTISGDLHIIKPVPDGILIAVVDGLGHGDEATVAARAAIRVLANRAREPLISTVHQCHEALMATRGAVMSAAFIDTAKKTLTWLGVGNVEGLLVRADPVTAPPTQTLLLRAGVLGYQMSTLQDSVVPLAARDLLIFVTDGIQSNFPRAIVPGDSPRQIADRILEKCFKGVDDALVLVVRYRGKSHE